MRLLYNLINNLSVVNKGGGADGVVFETRLCVRAAAFMREADVPLFKTNAVTRQKKYSTAIWNSSLND